MPDLELHLAPEHSQSRVLRSKVRAWCAAEGYTTTFVDDVVLVASELFSNAVRATAGDKPITFHLSSSKRGAVLRMENKGSGFNPDDVPPPHPGSVGGRGIWLAKALGRLSVSQMKTQTIVTVVMR